MLQSYFFSLDPGYTNLRMATRGTLTILSTYFIIFFFAQLLHLPSSLAFLGVMVALFSSMFINDSSKRQQKITLIAMIPPIIFGLGISLALNSFPKTRLVTFLAVTFFSVYLRRFGTRWFSAGFVTFMAFCAPLFFPTPAEAVPWAIASVIVAMTMTYLIRFIILPDRPRRIFKHYIRSFEFQTSFLLKKISSELEHFIMTKDHETSVKLEKSRISLRNSVNKVNELVLLIEQLLKSEDFQGSKSQSENLQMFFFERELAVRQALYSYYQMLLNGDVKRDQLQVLAEYLKQKLRGRNITPPEIPGAQIFLKDFDTAIESQKKQLDDLTSLKIYRKQSPHPRHKNVSPEVSGRFLVTTRQAIQVTLATGLASVLGQFVSPQRWYWASAAAFLIFAGSTRGETFVRALNRTLGTVVGLLIGFSLSHLLKGQTTAEWTLVIFCVFFGLFGFRMAFGFWAATLFTTILAVLFDVLGVLSPQLLLLRFEETVIGVFIGALVSAIVLPISTRALIRKSLVNLLIAMRDVLRELPYDPTKPSAKKILVDRLNRMDRELLNLRTAAAPIVGKISFSKQGDLTAGMFDSTALSHLIRHLATYAAPIMEFSPSELTSICQRIQQDIESQIESLERGNELNSTRKPFVLDKKTSAPLGRLFERIEQTLNLFVTRKF